MAAEKKVVALFEDDTRAASAIEGLAGYPWKLEQVHSPIPSDKILSALKVKKSRVGYFTLAGGIVGFLSGVSLAIYSGIQWNLVASGKPVIALIPFLIVGFEFTVLFAVFGNVLGLLLETNLPEFESLRNYDQRCSGEHFGIVASCSEGEESNLLAFFKEKGGEARLI
jgi:molybdopterin-containing oxidoreductase family membrane subunit